MHNVLASLDSAADIMCVCVYMTDNIGGGEKEKHLDRKRQWFLGSGRPRLSEKQTVIEIN